ncbi:MAG: pirin family protein [Bacteroidetes bacterium]|nr:pirin family protein [Bacteroidota bacterium]MBS1974410.1 pirin family protein [Bacteroidota bacterium]
MTVRTISTIETATVEMVGANKVLQALPTRSLKQVDPFILIHHMVPADVKPGASIRIPPHPHAGFEVVTYLIDGEFFHRDSKGHDVVAKKGDINWMTSGSGIVHSEGPTEGFLKTGGRLQLMQVWINLPAKYKFVEAAFRNYPAAGFPVIEGENSSVKVLIGNYEGHQSPVETKTPMFYYHIQLKEGNAFSLNVTSNFSSALYVMSGKLKSGGKEIKVGQLVNYNITDDEISFSAIENADVIAFGGEPLKEKVVSYGPFVMNSFEEIQHAIHDYETGKMGALDY